MDHLLESWDEVKDLLMNPIFLTLDYDGTLVPIENSPEKAELSYGTRSYLSQLTGYCPVAIISARSLDDLKSRVGIENVYYSGNHGHEISGPDVNFVSVEGKQARPAIRSICDKIRRSTSSLDGVRIKDKGFTASVDYRYLDKEDIPELMKVFEETIEPYEDEGIVEAVHSKESFEIRPGGGWDKGRAVLLLRRVTGFEEETIIVYLGDDVTDEDVFFNLRLTGLGILVSSEERETAAHFRLMGIDEVRIFLGKLVDFLEKA